MSSLKVFGNIPDDSQSNSLSSLQNQCQKEIEQTLNKFDKLEILIKESIYDTSKNTDSSKNSALTQALDSAYSELTDLTDYYFGPQNRSDKCRFEIDDKLPPDLRGVSVFWGKINSELEVVKRKMKDPFCWTQINFYSVEEKLKKIMSDIDCARFDFNN